MVTDIAGWLLMFALWALVVATAMWAITRLIPARDPHAEEGLERRPPDIRDGAPGVEEAGPVRSAESTGGDVGASRGRKRS